MLNATDRYFLSINLNNASNNDSCHRLQQENIFMDLEVFTVFLKQCALLSVGSQDLNVGIHISLMASVLSLKVLVKKMKL